MIDNSHNGYDGQKLKAGVTIGNCVPLLILLVFLLMIAVSCTSTKQVTKQTTTVDSSAVKELSDSIRVLKTENDKLSSEIAELQYGIVRFDTVYVPGDTVVNTITITKDGEIKATGKISSAYVSKSVLTKIVNEKQRVIDSLSLVKQKEVVRVVTKIEYKDKYKKTSVLNFWWLLIIGFIGGFIISKKIKL